MIGYNLDPIGRVRETVSTGTTNSTVTSHYAGSGDSPAWTVTTSGSWTRNIAGIGGLAAIQSDGEAPILQLPNLHGDIVATASMSETESKLEPTNETTEYGAPRTPITTKYSWLGADQLQTELPTGMINMGARAYIPQLGRFEQTDPQPGGSINAYAYTTDDPVNDSDPSGEYTSTVTYDYEAAETGPAREGLSEHYSGPGAIAAPPADMQLEEEFAAHPPWDAASIFEGGGGEGGDPIATIATRAKTPEGRFAEAQCDKQRDYLESKGKSIGNFTGQLQAEPGGRYAGTSYALLYETEFAVVASGPSVNQESTCHVIVSVVYGHYHVTHGPHFRVGQGLNPPVA
jgi:RHS repeat-associated protein